MYQKTGGKNAKNEAVAISSNLCALSRISVQVFEYNHTGLQFTCKPTTTLPLNAFQFAHLPSYEILTLLTNKPHSVNDSGFDTSQGDIDLYHTLNRGLESIQAAMKLFRKRNTDTLLG
jgi:hypothetical protein